VWHCLASSSLAIRILFDSFQHKIFFCRVTTQKSTEMVQLKSWQVTVLLLPIAALVTFVSVAAGFQIHQWGINWIWAIILLVLLGWRILLVRWLRPATLELEVMETALGELQTAPEIYPKVEASALNQKAKSAAQSILQAVREDVPPWENWPLFFGRCQELVTAIAQVYFPEQKRPLLNIYVPQAYGLIRATVDDVDRWMQKLSPVLGKVSVGQAYEAYELYTKLEPTARKALRIFNWTQWLLNPAVAIAKITTAGYSTRANQQLLLNLGQILREETLKALATQAIALYSRQAPQELDWAAPESPSPQSQTLKEILAQAQNQDKLDQQPVSLLLVGRTGAGKSSLINTLFSPQLSSTSTQTAASAAQKADTSDNAQTSPQAGVDLLPSTDRLQSYHWQTETGESLILWDAPGYEQVGRADLREEVLAHAADVDAVLLVTPATDPAVQMDLDFLQAAKATAPDLPMIGLVTQVDRLRPLREWQPPYDWQDGNRPKERSIWEAVDYRRSRLGDYCQTVLPLVTGDALQDRTAWGVTELSTALVNSLDPAKQFRLARFLRDLEARTAAAAQIIDGYAFTMSTTQGLATLLKSPILNYISVVMTGSPNLAILLSQKLPIEQSPVVLGKLQMAHELFTLLAEPEGDRSFDLQLLWPLLLETHPSVNQDAWAFGQMLIEYWSGALTLPSNKEVGAVLRDRYTFYRGKAEGRR
jgi:uncharacterized protein